LAAAAAVADLREEAPPVTPTVAAGAGAVEPDAPVVAAAEAEVVQEAVAAAARPVGDAVADAAASGKDS
jgi:hypothetical protein